MKRSFLFILVVMTLSTLVFAQKKEKPDLSGIWILDEKRSKKPFEDLFRKQKKDSAPSLKTTNFLVVDHAEPRLKIIEKQTVEIFEKNGASIGKNEEVLTDVIYFTDGRGESNLFASGLRHTSVTKWKGNKLTVVVPLNAEKKQYSIFRFTLTRDKSELTVLNMGFSMEYDFETHQNHAAPLPLGSKKVYKKADQKADQ